MSNGTVCCLLSVCCPAGSQEQLDAFIKEMEHDGVKIAPEQAAEVAKWIVNNFDLAPAGTLAPYRDAILAHERKPKATKAESNE